MKIQTIAGIVGLAFTTLGASGAVISETVTFGPTNTASPDFQLKLKQFDPVLGTLTKIDLTLEVTTTSAMTFDNGSLTPGTVSLQVGDTVTAKVGQNIVSQFSVAPSVTGSGSVAASNDVGGPDYIGTDSFSISGSKTLTSTLTRTTQPYLQQFTATNTLPAGKFFFETISNTAIASSTASVNGSTNSSGSFAGKFTVTYTYNALAAVPEAGTIFFGASLAMLLAFRRPRSRMLIS